MTDSKPVKCARCGKTVAYIYSTAYVPALLCAGCAHG